MGLFLRQGRLPGSVVLRDRRTFLPDPQFDVGFTQGSLEVFAML